MSSREDTLGSAAISKSQAALLRSKLKEIRDATAALSQMTCVLSDGYSEVTMLISEDENRALCDFLFQYREEA